MLEAFGQRLRAERLRIGGDQAVFGAVGAVTRNSQSSYERGQTAPSVEYLYRIAEHGADIGYILTGQRNDGSLGWEEIQMLEMFGKLSAREREAVFSMLSVLVGNTVAAADLPKRVTAVAPPRLHDPARPYRPGSDAEN